MTNRLWLFFLLPLIHGTGTDAATLRDHIVVRGEVIRVGDLFRGTAEAGKAVVGRAPAPGRREVFERRRLRNIAVRHKLDWTPNNRYVRAVVERAGRLIGRAEIENALQRVVKRRFPDQHLKTTLFNQNLKIHAALDSAKRYWFEDLRYDERSGRLAATMVVPTGERSASRVGLTGRAYAVVRVPVLNRPVGRGDVVRKDDVRWERLPKTRIRGDVITDAGAVIGLAARRGLRPGVPLRGGDLRRPVLVSRGSLVTVLLETRHMMLTTKGKAMTDGALGQTVQVVNTRSKRIVEAIVDGAGRVRVPDGDASTHNGGAS